MLSPPETDRWLRRHLPLAGGALALLLLFPILLWMLGPSLPPPIPLEHVTAFHTAVEVFAVIVAVMVFAVGYHVLDRRRVAASLILACGFLGVAILDFLHLMTYPALPDFITPNSSQQTLYFWLAARLFAAIALLLYVALPTFIQHQTPSRAAYLAGTLILVTVLAWIGLWHVDQLPALFRTGEGLTPSKIAVEGVVVALHAATLLVLLIKRELLARPGMPLVAGALVISVAGEVFFMLYQNLNDGFFVLGHVYKVLAYLLIYQGMFMASVRAPMENLKAAHKAIEAREQRYQQLIETAPDGVLVTDTQGRIQMANRNIERLFGYPREHLIGQPVELLVPERHRERHRQQREHHPERISARTMGQVPHLRGRRIDGSEFPVDISLNAFEDQNGRRITAFVHDTTERHRREARIQHQATHDSLTGLPNRWLLHDRLGQAIANAERSGGQLAVMLLDLDNFKMVNDTFGHHEGDQLLKQVTRRLDEALHGEVTLGRFGGDEFMILVEDLESTRDIGPVAQRILEVFETPFHTELARQISSSGSLGIALFPRDASDERSLLRYADMAMYQAKRAGRNTFAFFSEELDRQVHAEQRLQERLKRALEQNELELHYQPQLDIHDDRMIGVEALLRWTDSELGAVSPARFIPSAEDNGLMLPLGDWVFDTACRQLAAWVTEGIELPLSVNLSALQFRQTDLIDRLQQVLDTTGAPPHLLELEITETVAMADVDLARQQLAGLRRLGIRVALDDFGTGYSSLAYLKDLPIDKLKIDRSFVRDIGGKAARGSDEEMILRAIIHLGHSLRLQLTAEGVETQAQLAFLREAGCDAYQGWLHSQAMPAAALAREFSMARPNATPAEGGEASQ